MNRLEIPKEFRFEMDAHSERLRVMEEQRGPEYTHHWIQARPFLDFDGKVRRPPTAWSFVSALLARGSGSGLPMNDRERADSRQFWDWYLRVESNVLELMAQIRWFAKHGDARMTSDLCMTGHALVGIYRGWLQDQTIQWLPRRPPNEVTIVDALSQCMARLVVKSPEGERAP